jgi:hypothetical protein
MIVTDSMRDGVDVSSNEGFIEVIKSEIPNFIA